MMRACTLLLALASARAQTDNMQDPMITTSGGSIVISADDIQFTTPNQSTSINGLVRDVAQNFSSIRGEIARVNVSLTSRIDAALGPILTRLEDAETAAANPRLPVVTTFADLPACNPAGVGVMTYLSEADGCKSAYVCLPGGLRQRTSYAGPVAGAARCNPAADCRAAIASAQNQWDSVMHIRTTVRTSVAGTFFLGVVGGGVRQARCEDSGLEAGDGSASTPGLSCESIYTHHPTQKARGPQVYKMFSPEGHGQFTGFPRTISPSTGTREGRTITCSGTRNATHTIGIMYGNPAGSVRRYNYYILPESTNRASCTNSVFGDPHSGASKYCYCGWYVRGTVDVKCNPTIDRRVSLTGLVGWWRAEDYQFALTSAEWPSLNPAVMFGTGPAITNRVAQIENPQGWSREARYQTADNNAHARYNGLVGRSRYNQELERNPGFFPNPAGTPGTAVNFGPLTTQYAICTTSRYMNSASSRGRIFVGSSGNWLHGHWASRTNVVHYGGWATSSRGQGWRYDWIVTCTTYGGGSGRNFLYRYGGVSILSNWRGIRSGAGKEFGIGIGQFRTRETSVYAFGEVLIYNVRKSAAELRNLALYLTDRLNGRQ
jgi:hypothetical protein